MKKINLFGAALLIAMSSMIYSCKKDKKDDPTPVDTEQTEVANEANDESDVQSTSDEISDDVNGAMDGSTSVGGRYSSPPPPCGGTVLVDSAARTITITYSGLLPCNGKTRTGTVVATLVSGNRWRDQGARISIVVNLTVSKLGRSIKIEGTKTITNITGGLIRELASGYTITHAVRANFNITLPNGTTKRSWQVARRINYKRDADVRSIEVSGDTTINGTPGIVMWGTNRNGQAFKNVIISAIKANSNCGWNRPTAGVRAHSGNRTFKATFGLNMAGNPMVGGDCATHFRLEWTNHLGEPKNAILPY